MKAIFLFKISSLTAELEALKKEKGETEEAKKTAEEQIEAMRTEHDQKVILCKVITMFAKGRESPEDKITVQTFAQSAWR